MMTRGLDTACGREKRTCWRLWSCVRVGRLGCYSFVRCRGRGVCGCGECGCGRSIMAGP
ncbi:hypothetical protein BDW02DRAFT_224574 [Decorospora gaudefroyi]|uniref:Uncharacterized protein n=1 Tax=Decorospora gaudefroyi TaxID=184978 RepID=A0A6A5KK61_9PLEO|nr:hypothetical protein BDW02DRAFT_224574 [Decorospora gaudefroyi]